MNRVASCLTFLLLPAAMRAQEQPQDSSNVLEGIVIQEAFEAENEEEKVPLVFDVDFSNAVEIKDALNWQSLDNLIDRQDGRRLENAGLRFFDPVLANIRPAPVQIFRTNFKNVSRWQLHITASDGSIFRRFNGAGSPPREIPWDGKSDVGETLVAGKKYSYNFIAFDKAGNKRAFPGKSFSVSAFYSLDDGELLIGVANSVLFSEDGLRLKPDAEAYAREIAGLIRYFSKQAFVSVEAEGGPSDLAFLNLVAEELATDQQLFECTEPVNVRGSSLRFRVK